MSVCPRCGRAGTKAFTNPSTGELIDTSKELCFACRRADFEKEHERRAGYNLVSEPLRSHFDPETWTFVETEYGKERLKN